MTTQGQIRRLFRVHPTIYGLLKGAEDVRDARNFLISYIEEMSRYMNREYQQKKPLEWIVQTQSIQAFRRMLSIRSERLTGVSLVKLLWQLVHHKKEELPADLNEDFFEEMIHLFLAIQGKSGIYDEEIFPDFARLQGRDAAISRSEQLDRMARHSNRFIRRYRTGLEPAVVKRRTINKRRILSKFQAAEAQWQDYRWHLDHVIRTGKKLSEIVTLSPEEREGIAKAKAGNLPFGITPYYASLMDRSPGKNDYAVRAQVIPSVYYSELMQKFRNDAKSHSLDFMLEEDTSPIDLITRRYPMIVILKPFNTCSQICVYCQRNWEIDDVLDPEAMASPAKLQRAIQWIKETPEIEEVLVTGGDPLVMEDEQIDHVLRELSKINHVIRIRIGSRTPVVLPMRVTESLGDIIAGYHEPGTREVALVTHFSHAYEVTPESMEAVQKFKRRGMSVYNQAVFTMGNSRRFELVALRKALRLIGVDSYYTFSTKGKEETRDYRVPLARLQQEIKEEARLMPGLVRTDEAVYNVPKLGKNYIRAQQNHSLLSIFPNGRRVYEFHPWEKNLSLADTFVDTDVSINGYLMTLRKRGENIRDYKTIWYYY